MILILFLILRFVSCNDENNFKVEDLSWIESDQKLWDEDEWVLKQLQDITPKFIHVLPVMVLDLAKKSKTDLLNYILDHPNVLRWEDQNETEDFLELWSMTILDHSAFPRDKSSAFSKYIPMASSEAFSQFLFKNFHRFSEGKFKYRILRYWYRYLCGTGNLDMMKQIYPKDLTLYGRTLVEMGFDLSHLNIQDCIDFAILRDNAEMLDFLFGSWGIKEFLKPNEFIMSAIISKSYNVFRYLMSNRNLLTARFEDLSLQFENQFVLPALLSVITFRQNRDAILFLKMDPVLSHFFQDAELQKALYIIKNYHELLPHEDLIIYHYFRELSPDQIKLIGMCAVKFQDVELIHFLVNDKIFSEHLDILAMKVLATSIGNESIFFTLMAKPFHESNFKDIAVAASSKGQVSFIKFLDSFHLLTPEMIHICMHQPHSTPDLQIIRYLIQHHFNVFDKEDFIANVMLSSTSILPNIVHLPVFSNELPRMRWDRVLKIVADHGDAEAFSFVFSDVILSQFIQVEQVEPVLKQILHENKYDFLKELLEIDSIWKYFIKNQFYLKDFIQSNDAFLHILKECIIKHIEFLLEDLSQDKKYHYLKELLQNNSFREHFINNDLHLKEFILSNERFHMMVKESIHHLIQVHPYHSHSVSPLHLNSLKPHPF